MLVAIMRTLVEGLHFLSCVPRQQLSLTTFTAAYILFLSFTTITSNNNEEHAS
jgi:hypothetical protein